MKTGPYTISIACLFAFLSLSIKAAEPVPAKPLIHDEFNSSEMAERNAARGDWKIANGQAKVAHNDELYKKFKNHGPIMIYTVDHTDANAVVEFKPNGCKTVVFTMDAKEGGHAFRVKLMTAAKPGSTIVTYGPKEGKEKAPVITLSRDVPELIDGNWNRIEMTVKGSDATVTVNGKKISVSHKRISQPKKIAKIGFAFGDFTIRKFDLNSL